MRDPVCHNTILVELRNKFQKKLADVNTIISHAIYALLYFTFLLFFCVSLVRMRQYCKEVAYPPHLIGNKRQNLERFTNLRVILAQGPC